MKVCVGLAVLLLAPLAIGQAPPAGQPQPAAPAAPAPQQQQPMNPALWQHLLAWEAVMKGAANFVSETGTKTETDLTKTPPVSKVFKAIIWCLKPNMARMQLLRVPPAGQKADPTDYTTYICNGRSVFEYDGSARDVNGKPTPTVTEFPLNPGGGVGGNLLLEFMSGSITAQQAANRFNITWINQNDPTYLILELVPREAKDKQDFEKMTLVLIKPGLQPPLNQLAYLPRLAKIVKPDNKAEEVWDFPEPKLNAVRAAGQPIGPGDFQYIDPGKGWRIEKANARPPAMPPAGPRVARPNGP